MHYFFFKQAKALQIQPELSGSLQADTLEMSTKRIGAPNFPTNPFRNALELKQDKSSESSRFFLTSRVLQLEKLGLNLLVRKSYFKFMQIALSKDEFFTSKSKTIFIKGLTIHIIQIYIQMNILSMQNISVNFPIMRGPSRSSFLNDNFNKNTFLIFFSGCLTVPVLSVLVCLAGALLNPHSKKVLGSNPLSATQDAMFCDVSSVVSYYLYADIAHKTRTPRQVTFLWLALCEFMPHPGNVK